MSKQRSARKGGLPVQISRTYAPAGICIYCGGQEKLEDEHIFPFGLGGKIILPKASCRNCSKRSSAYEGTCQRTMFGSLRMVYDMPTRRKKARPQTLPLAVKYTADQAEWTTINVPREDVPCLVLMPHFEMPGLLTGSLGPAGEMGPGARSFWTRGATGRHGFEYDSQELIARLGVHSIKPVGDVDVPAFCLMLAKIAHSFAMAELGYGSFAPLLVPTLCEGDLAKRALFIGSNAQARPAVPLLHEIAVGFNPTRNLVLVQLRLLACLGAPTYFIVVGRAEGIDPVSKGRIFLDAEC